ncbi:rRNA maturation RNase YbeY [Alteromonas sp. ASW11-36]|uniref:Endoribonuclease YbeY n=1 Tax=Alteromonas arenosi TaxID=3055817 RepID=A0ABT7SYD4_9ALTE|nr:rRNA maturation RNase YbeY [Alteromonas sp. ASW11-36]MDM7861207.1 rRNA maturation RNase YbeY [Alteromonas sp. ASW11-36]
MTNQIDLQHACDNQIPALEDFECWTTLALDANQLKARELTIRLVNSDESQQLNAQYRGKDKPTNVLSFPFECPPEVDIPLLGDLVICADVVEREATEQNKPLNHHYAHLTIHGVLHLLGFDHIDPEQAVEMESLETRLLAKLGIDDPYQDH